MSSPIRRSATGSRRSGEPEFWWLTSWSRWPLVLPGKRSWRSGAATSFPMPFRKQFVWPARQNILDGQRLLLEANRIMARQIGVDIGRKGIKDDEIVVL